MAEHDQAQERIGSGIVLSKVHSRPTQGDSIELERLGSLIPRRTTNPIFQAHTQKEEREQPYDNTLQNGTSNNKETRTGSDTGAGASATGSYANHNANQKANAADPTSIDIEIDESLFDTKGKVAMTRAPSMKLPVPSPLVHMRTSPSSLPGGSTPLPLKSKISIARIPSFKMQHPPFLENLAEEAESAETEESLSIRSRELNVANTSKDKTVAPVLSMSTEQEKDEATIDVQPNENDPDPDVPAKPRADDKAIELGSRRSEGRRRSTSRNRSIEAPVASQRSGSRGRQTMKIYEKEAPSSGTSVSKSIGNYFGWRSRSRSKSRNRSKSRSVNKGTVGGKSYASSSESPTKKKLFPPSYNSAAPKSTDVTQGNYHSQSGINADLDIEPGVVWVRSFSSRRGGSIFVGENAARSNVGNSVSKTDNTSIESTDSQELYALRKVHGFNDIQNSKSGIGRGTAQEAVLSISESEDDEDSDDDMTMDTYANYTMEESDESSDEDDDSDFDDDSIDTDAVGLGISSVAGGKTQRSIKTTLSDVSGSFDDDEVLGNSERFAEDIVQEPVDIENEIQKRKKAEIERKKKKKRVFKMGTGLGRKKGEMTMVKTETKKTKVSKRGITGIKKVKTTNMKKSGRKAPKKKVIQKKKGVQLRTIRLNGQLDQDYMAPRKGDPGVKVMRVCKLTSQGYVAAEFTSIDPLNTPLHIACLTHYPTRFILDHLLKSDTDLAVATENSSGELPIHYAVMDKKSVDPDIFEALIEKFPESVNHKNIDDSLPIHVACQVGAPSLYSIKRLLEINPDSALAQNDLQVPLNENDEDLDDDEHQMKCHEMLCFNWTKEDGRVLAKYETGWTPLHLAAVNGAPPDVIEAIIEANIECMHVVTNKKRSPMECAKSVVINAILNDIEMYKVQNIFNAIEVMQSYEKEIRYKQELALKAGIVIAVLENSGSYGDWWMGVAEMLPTREKVDEVLRRDRGDRFDEGDYDYGDDVWGEEKGMTNLHRAVLKKAEPDTIHKMMEDHPECMDIISTMDRTPFECAKMVIIRGLLNKDPIATLTDTFITLEIMQAYKEARDGENEEFNATAALSRAKVNNLKSRHRQVWGSKADAYEYMKHFLRMDLSGESLLGKTVTVDTDSAIQPFEFFPPANLRHVSLRLNVPVGFRRLRKALLHQRADFLKIAVYAERLKNKKIKIIPWSKNAKAMSQTKLKKGDKFSDFVGATRTISYMVPKSEIGGAHMSYETVELIEYNDYCFAVKCIIKNPDLPFGSEYETHCQIIVIDKGINTSRMICSSEMIVTGMVMDDDWQVRNSMRHRATTFFYALGEAICMHAGSDVAKEKDKETSKK